MEQLTPIGKLRHSNHSLQLRPGAFLSSAKSDIAISLRSMQPLSGGTRERLW